MESTQQETGVRALCEHVKVMSSEDARHQAIARTQLAALAQLILATTGTAR